VIPPAIFFYYSTLFDSRFKTLQQNHLFVYVGGLLVVTLALAKVIQQLLSEAEGSQEADIWYTIINSFKAGGLIVIMPFIISVTMNGIVQPISSYFIEEMGILTVDNIEGVMNAETMPDIFSEGLNQVILMLFLLIVIGFYAFKLFVSQAQILILEILSPLVAVSVVSDDYDFMDNWWRDLLSHTVTIMVLTLCMALFTEALTMDTETIWGKLPLLIGSGALVLSGPSLLKSIWFSSGAGRAGGGVARTLMYRVMR
ncbi:conjugal transfer protein TrbL family protein, partial [Enterococcus faecium]|uniref:conjugal transfer protein TrbL family protein n=2 Tax=Enterococcus faecium TaxID=1352 RepID=UPI0015DDDEAD